MADVPNDALVIPIGSLTNEVLHTLRALKNLTVQFGQAPYNSLVIDKRGNRAILNIGSPGFTADSVGGVPAGYSEVNLAFCHPTLGPATGTFMIKNIVETT